MDKFDHRLTKVEEQAERNTGRIKKLEAEHEALNKLATSVAVLTEREERMESDVKEIKTDVKILAGKPAKKWDDMTSKIIAVVVGAIVGYILTQVGIG